MKPERLDKLFSRLGICSRLELKQLIQQKKILIDGELAIDGKQKVDPEYVRFNNRKLQYIKKVAVIFYKPAGKICSRFGTNTIFDFFPDSWLRRRPIVNSAGRLDRDTTGILILTDDGFMNHKLTSPNSELIKTYEIELLHPFRGNEPELFQNGIQLRSESVPCKSAELIIRGQKSATLIIREGKYHQVKRMIGAVGNRVLKLHRSYIGELGLGDLRPGEWRDVQTEDLYKLGLAEIKN